jgi:hypothetical protein
VETALLILLAKVGAGALAGGLIAGIGQEAGKDLWQGIKNLVTKTWKKQADNTYTLANRTFVVSKQNGDYVAVELRVVTPQRREEAPTEQDFQRAFDEKMTLLVKCREEIEQQIAKLQSEPPPPVSESTLGWLDELDDIEDLSIGELAELADVDPSLVERRNDTIYLIQPSARRYVVRRIRGWHSLEEEADRHVH